MKRLILFVLMLAMMAGCDEQPTTTAADSGVKKVTVDVPTNAEGVTVEQDHIRKRLLADNTPGAIKHLYVISAFTGDVLLYSTVQAKVTSSGKRLTPNTVAANTSQYSYDEGHGLPVRVGGKVRRTAEVLQDDGTYGSSIHYLYWWDAQGRYHQHYPAGGQIIHISDQPIRVDKVVLTLSDDE